MNQPPSVRQQNFETRKRNLKAERRERDLQDFVPGEDKLMEVEDANNESDLG